jgi:hypothetical protein
MSGLEQKGFETFRPWEMFISAFCDCRELATHQTYIKEEAKVRIGAPDGMPGHLTGKERGYMSPIIAAMRHERDIINGVGYTQISNRDLWKRYIDPCVRRLEKLQMQQDPIVQKRRDEMYAAFHRKRDQEITLHSSAHAVANIGEPESLARLCCASLEKNFASFGFARNDARSNKFLPVFSKSLTDEWDICISPESDRTFRLLSRTNLGDYESTVALNLRLYVCAKNYRRSVQIPLGFDFLDMMLIRYEFLVPGFAWAYSNFASAADIEVIAAAHATLYELVSNFLEPTLVTGLISAEEENMELR